MKNLIITLFLFLPFFATAQTNKQDSFVESFTSNGYIKNKKFIDKVTVITVDWYADSLFVGGGGYSFKIVGKEKLKGFAGTTLTYIKLDNGQLNTLISDSEGLRGLYNPDKKLHFEVEIGDVWAEMEMENGNK